MKKANYKIILNADSTEDGVNAQMSFIKDGKSIDMYRFDYDDLEALIGTSANLYDRMLSLYNDKKAIDKFNEENR